MTVTNTSTLSIFTNPLSIPYAPPSTSDPVLNQLQGSNAQSVNASSSNPLVAESGGLALGGSNVTYTTTNFEATPQNIVLTGEGNRINLGGGAANIAILGGGQIVESAQFLGTDSGKMFSVNLGGDNSDGLLVSNTAATIDLNAQVSGNVITDEAGNPAPQVTIAEASGGMAQSNTNFYIHGGTGNDTIIGSFLNDFLRGGAGDDTIAAYAGNDIIRGGSGSDFIQLGADAAFSDTLYYTTDQVVNGDVDTMDQFNSGTDRIVFDQAIDSTIVFSGGNDTIGYTSIEFSSGGQHTVLNVINGGKIFRSDIFFLS